MMTLTELDRVVNRIVFHDWDFVVDERDDGFSLQVEFQDHRGIEQAGRKWYISAHAIPEEVIQTALKAVLTALEHEAREAFTVDGRAIFGPHFSLEALIGAVDTHQEARRPLREEQSA